MHWSISVHNSIQYKYHWFIRIQFDILFIQIHQLFQKEIKKKSSKKFFCIAHLIPLKLLVIKKNGVDQIYGMHSIYKTMNTAGSVTCNCLVFWPSFMMINDKRKHIYRYFFIALKELCKFFIVHSQKHDEGLDGAMKWKKALDQKQVGTSSSCLKFFIYFLTIHDQSGILTNEIQQLIKSFLITWQWLLQFHKQCCRIVSVSSFLITRQ